MIAEFEVPFWLESPEGTLAINQTDTDGRRWQLVPSECKGRLPVRATEDDIPQGDGKIPHRRWRSGYGVHLALSPQIWPNSDGSDAEPACDTDLVEMMDELGLHLNAMIRTGLVPGLPNGRLVWTPSGAANRMIDRAQLASEPDETVGGGPLGGMLVQFDLDTAYPYYMEEAETQTTLYGFGTQTITNPGNTDFYLVIDIFGDVGGTSYVSLINHSIQDINGNDLLVIYDSALPGAIDVPAAPDFLRINFFRGTAYLNGDSTNMKAGLDLRYTDFFPLIPGENILEIIGGSGGLTALVRSNGAWG